MHIVFGGSFNPPTNAHVHIIKHLKSLFVKAKIIVVPVGDDYRKPELASFKHRYAMLELALSDLSDVILSNIESKRGYEGTLKTLDDLSLIYDDLHFVIGSDNLHELDTWINYKELLNKYPLIVMKRPGYMIEQDADQLYKDIPHRFIFIDFDDPSASSNVRQNLYENKHLLHPKVYQYIKTHQIYEVKDHV
ncbi:MAG: nicotinate (nicotinamide) nucleotide adenylyltransferase [Acholeplasmataceae bacterium]|jgi:nicotinate-nucleotide adenylyltransferase|nr:nicotinate (nicotinamide) nucleotide adenylyltransferase [Acholeplasmataceae bacterium]